MKVYSAYFSPLVLVFLFSVHIGSFDDKAPDSLYEQGQEQLQKGSWKQALNTWLKAKSKIGTARDKDPRIGFAFIDVVTSKQAKEYFQIADEMYFWGIKNADVNRYQQVLQGELDRLKPLMGSPKANKLQDLLNEHDPAFTAELTAFWVKRDPFPSSKYNERLLEHWQRIQYARKEFSIRQNTPFQTDDRGLIYVRFGSPTEIKQRSISINRIIDPVSGTNIPLNNNIAVKAEIWYYYNLTDEQPFSSFVFGRPSNGGAFGLQSGLLSMIPVSGNRISSYYDDQKVLAEVVSQSSFGGSASGTKFDNSGGGRFVLPGYTQVSREGAELMLKYAVLEEVGAIDSFYNSLYNTMTSDIIKASMSNRDEKFTHTARANLPSYKNKEVSSAMLRDRIVPANISDAKTAIEGFEVDQQILRFMDSELKTIYILATEAVDYQPLMVYAGTRSQDVSRSEIVQLNTLYQYDRDWNLAVEQPHMLPLNNKGHFGKAVYYFDEDARRQLILFSSQYLDKNPSKDSERRHKKLNAHIIASTQARELQFPAPLQLQGTKKMELSDILLADIQQEDHTQRIPFVPNLDRTFKGDESMMVYFEAYNLPADKDYQVEYKIEGIDKKERIQKIGRSIILNYNSTGSVSPNWFEVSLADLPKFKKYQLALNLRLSDSEETIKRVIDFYLE
jgi:GWxTD domain-containing protein